MPSKKWKEFRVGDLFEIQLSKGDNQAKLLEDGIFPLVSAGSVNNGICKYVLTGDGVSEKFPYNILTMDMFGKVFYQPATFYAVSHGRVNMMIPTGRFNKWQGLFIVATLEQGSKGKYSFANMCNQSRLQRAKMLLPVDVDGTPDYEYMEQYIKNKMYAKYNQYLEFYSKS